MNWIEGENMSSKKNNKKVEKCLVELDSQLKVLDDAIQKLKDLEDSVQKGNGGDLCRLSDADAHKDCGSPPSGNRLFPFPDRLFPCLLLPEPLY